MTELILRNLFPTQTQLEWGIATSILGTTFSYLIGFNESIIALLLLMLMDYITGVSASFVNPKMMLNSQKGFKGICKKFLILCLVSTAHILDIVTGTELMQVLVVWFFIGNEGLSILENAANAGVPVPNFLKDTLEQVKERGNNAESKCD